ncbi:acyltransferase family protein [Labilibaculum sp.]|uniref:acyltransferase family protein n=1 Tax=Labilibaculum sp. TaxID=2060723 RepID=UPI00356849AE
MKQRLEYVDQMRGIAIIGHLIQFNDLAGGTQNPLFEFIYSFHMPLFFMISGYIANKVTNIHNFRSYGNFILKKFRTLLVPLFVWSLIINKFFFSAHWSFITLDDIKNVILNPGLWFLKTLFEIFLVYGLFQLVSMRIDKQNKLFLDIFLLVIILSILFGGYLLVNNSYFGSLLLYTISFYTGVFISKYAWIEKLVMNKWVFTICTSGFMIFGCHWVFGGNMIDDLYKIIISVMSFISIMNICRRIKWKPIISNQFILFGKESLAIYIIQFYLTDWKLENAGLGSINSFVLLTILFSTSVFIAYLCVGFSRIIALIPFFNYTMLGRKDI